MLVLKAYQQYGEKVSSKVVKHTHEEEAAAENEISDRNILADDSSVWGEDCIAIVLCQLIRQS